LFTLDVHHDADYLLLRPRGELDLHSGHLFRERLTDLMREAALPLVLDLSDLQFIDSSGLGALLTILRVPEERRPRIVLSPANGPVGRLLRTTRLDLLLTVHPNLDAALAGRAPARSAA
jgi:anti-sigma B factor antagonist